jgi:putative membrane protein
MSAPATTPLDNGTRLAVDRTRLAHERTMMAWVRTGTSMISFGFTIYKFFELQAGGARATALLGPREFALIMIGTGLAALLLATLEHRRSLKLLTATYGRQPRSVSSLVAAIVSVMGLLAFAAALLRG